MKRGRGKSIAFGTVLTGLVTLGVFAFVERDYIAESWHIYRLRHADGGGKMLAARELGRRQSERAVAELGRLARKDDEVGRVSREALRQIRGTGYDELIAILDEPGSAMSQQVSELLVAETPPLVDLALRLLRKLATEGQGTDFDLWVLSGVLRGAGTAAADILAPRLRDRDPRLRRAVVLALGDLGLDAGVTSTLALEAARDEAPEVRVAALALLSDLRSAEKGEGREAATAAFVRALEDLAPRVRAIAAAALGRLEFVPRSVRQTLARGLEDDDETARQQSALALQKLDEPALFEILRRGPGRSRRVAVEVLADRARVEAVKVFVEILESDPEPETREALFSAFARLGRMARGAVPALSRELERSSGESRYRVVEVLAEIGPPAVEALEPLRKALRDEDVGLRQRAALALQAMGSAAAPAVPDLLRLLEDDDVAGFAADALGAVGPAALPLLLGALRHEDPFLRAAALEAITASDAAPEALPGILGVLEDPRSEVRYQALRVLEKISPDKLGEHAEVRGVLDDDEAAVRYLAAKLLVASGGETAAAAIAVLRDFVKDEGLANADRLEALGHLARAGSQAVPALAEGLRAGEPSVRRAAAAALGDLGEVSRAAAPALQEAAKDSDPRVREEARAALRKISESSPEAPPGDDGDDSGLEPSPRQA